MQASMAALELEKSREARFNGNEGMARVLARRAAGLAVREFLDSGHFDLGGVSLNTLIKDGEIRKQLPVSIHQALDRLTTRVGMDYQLPVEFDLLLDAQWVIEQLSINNGE